MPDFVRYFEEKKFMWDNVEYPDADAAKAAAETYEKDGFEVRIFEEEGNSFVYSRRIAAEVIVEGEQPI